MTKMFLITLIEKRKPDVISVIFLLTNFASICASPIVGNYNKNRPYQVFRIIPKSVDQLNFLADLYRRAHEYQLDFWKVPRAVNVFCDVMVPPNMNDLLKELIGKRKLEYHITVPDVRKLIEDNEGQRQGKSFSERKSRQLIVQSFLRRLKDDRSKNDHNGYNDTAFSEHYNFRDYGTYAQMVAFMRQIASQYPNRVKMVNIGLTHEKRRIYGLKIGRPINRKNKRIIWIDGGIHAREWASIHTALYFIHQLTKRYDKDKSVKRYVDTLSFYIFPCLNPDGYEFSRSSNHPLIRMWRKNRRPDNCSLNTNPKSVRIVKCCGAVDLNRNFDFHWGESGSSDDPCSHIYQGPSVFSEPESRAVRDLMESHELDGKVDAFITMHTYAQLWIHPFSHRPGTYPPDVNNLMYVGAKAVRALTSVHGTKYALGTGADTLAPASGGSDDWAKAKSGIKYVYLLELRPEEKFWNGFILNKNELLPTAEETWEGVKVVIDAVLRLNGSRSLKKSTRTEEGRIFASESEPKRRRNTTKKRPTILNWKTANMCIDLRYGCSHWVQKSPNFCHRNKSFMREQCPKSCRFC